MGLPTSKEHPKVSPSFVDSPLHLLALRWLLNFSGLLWDYLKNDEEANDVSNEENTSFHEVTCVELTQNELGNKQSIYFLRLCKYVYCRHYGLSI